MPARNQAEPPALAGHFSLTVSLRFYGEVVVCVAEFQTTRRHLSGNGTPRTDVCGRFRHVCASACFVVGHVLFPPPLNIHCVVVTCTKVMWCCKISSLRRPCSKLSAPFQLRPPFLLGGADFHCFLAWCLMVSRHPRHVSLVLIDRSATLLEPLLRFGFTLAAVTRGESHRRRRRPRPPPN